MGTEFYNRFYKPAEFYTALYKGIRTIKYMKRSKKNGEINEEFQERIMLAVTQVNGCELCSFAHTKMALENGMSNDEIQNILSGDMSDISKEEAVAVFFAQHYADMRGNPSAESWQRLVEEYGQEKALGILGAIRMIMIGNVAGIALSAFKSRLKGKPIKKSSLSYEILMLLSGLVFIPTAIIHGKCLDLFKGNIL